MTLVSMFVMYLFEKIISLFTLIKISVVPVPNIFFIDLYCASGKVNVNIVKNSKRKRLLVINSNPYTLSPGTQNFFVHRICVVCVCIYNV